MSSPHQAPGDWDAGETDWIDRVLDRAAERIESRESFEHEHDTVAPPRGAEKPVLTPTPDVVPIADASNDVLLSGAISAAEFSAAHSAIPGVSPLSTGPAARPVLELGDDLPLTPSAVGRSALTDDLANLGDIDHPASAALPWLNDDAPSDTQAQDELATLSEARPRGMVREWGPVLLLAVAVAVIFRMFLFTAYHIPSLSMAPTLDIGDRVVVNRLSYQLGDLERGQVVVFSRPPGQVGQADHLIKRVVGLPGDTVTVADGHIWIDGRRLSEPYLAQEKSSDPRTAAIPGCVNDGGSRTECVVPAGTVFVMGDNRRGSVDSRVFGPIDQDTIVGRAFVRIWVLDNVGWL